MSELPSIKLDYRINRLLEHLNPLRRAAADQMLFGTVTTQAELAKQHKVSPACTHRGDQTAASSPKETLEHRYWAYPKWAPFRKNYPELTASEQALTTEARKFGLLREPEQVLPYMNSLDKVPPTNYGDRDPQAGTCGTYATDGSAFFFSSYPRWRHCTWAAVLGLFEVPEAGLLPGLTQTMNRAELTAALCAMTSADDVTIFTDSMYVVRGCERIKKVHQRKVTSESLAARLTYATKSTCANHDLWHMVEDIWTKRGSRIRAHKVASTHSFKDVDKEAERPTAEATRRLGNLAADDAAKGVRAARSIWSCFDHKDVQAWCDQDKAALATHTKVVEYMAAFGLHVFGAATGTWGKSSPHGHRTPGLCCRALLTPCPFGDESRAWSL